MGTPNTSPSTKECALPPPEASEPQDSKPSAKKSLVSRLVSWWPERLTLGRLIIWTLGLGLMFLAAIILVPWFHKQYKAPGKNPFYDGRSYDNETCLKRKDFNWLVLASCIGGCLAVLDPFIFLVAARKSVAAPPKKTAVPGAVQRAGVRWGWTWRKMAVLALVVFINAFTFGVVVKQNISRINKGQTRWSVYKMGGKAPVPNRDAGRAFIFGRYIAWPGMVDFMFALFPVSRTTPIFALAGLTSEEAIWFHILCARLAIIWTTIHSVLEQFPMLTVSAKLFVYENWNPFTGNRYFLFAGNVAWLLLLVITVTSLKFFRTRFYNTFRAAHFLFIPMIVMSTIHLPTIYYFFLIPLNFWFADLANRWVWKTQSFKASLTPVVGSSDKGVLIRLSRRTASVNPLIHSVGDDVFIRIASISRFEWHPFSILSVDDDGFTLFAKAAGDWTGKLFALAETCASEPQPGLTMSDKYIDIDVEGPYDSTKTWAKVATAALRNGQQVAVFAGGAGITGSLGVLHHAAASLSDLTGMSFFWSVRSETLYEACKPAIAAVAAKGASAKVFLTDNLASRPDREGHGQGVAISDKDPKYAATAAADSKLTRSISSDSDSSNPGAKNASARSGASQRHGWVHVVVSVLIMFLTVAATASFFALGASASCKTSVPYSRLQDVSKQYVADVSAKYYNATGKKINMKNLTATWPKTQALNSTLRWSQCHLAGKTYEVVRCDMTNKHLFPYAKPGDGCDSNSMVHACYALPASLNAIFSLSGGIVVPILGAVLIKNILQLWTGRKLLGKDRYKKNSAPQESRSSTDSSEFNLDSIQTVKTPATNDSLISLHHGRPDMSDIAQRLASKGGAVTAYLCGAPSYRDAARRALARERWPAAITVQDLNFTN